MEKVAKDKVTCPNEQIDKSRRKRHRPGTIDLRSEGCRSKNKYRWYVKNLREKHK